jgi:hypothetical protein
MWLSACVAVWSYDEKRSTVTSVCTCWWGRKKEREQQKRKQRGELQGHRNKETAKENATVVTKSPS